MWHHYSRVRSPSGSQSVGSKVSKVQVVIMDRSGSHEVGLRLLGRFFGYVLGNPSIRATGDSEQEVTERIASALVIVGEGTLKVVEIDVAAGLIVQSIMES